MHPRSAPDLLAIALRLPRDGAGRCLFCGAAASTLYAIPDSFTDHPFLACPGSPVRCHGCEWVMAEVGGAVYYDGSRRPWPRSFGRGHSWVVTPQHATPATIGHLGWLRQICLSPPSPPYAISLSSGGQKHFFYRAPVVRGGGRVSMAFDGERIDYDPADLRAVLRLAGHVCASSGKPALAERPGGRLACRVDDRYVNGGELACAWAAAWGTPMARLAAFLCPPREESEREYPSDRHR